MNTDAILSGIVLVLFVLLLVVLHKARKARAEEQGPDAGLGIVEPPVDEDINAPSLETIDLALAHMDRDANPNGVDWLLDKRIDAMRRAT